MPFKKLALCVVAFFVGLYVLPTLEGWFRFKRYLKIYRHETSPEMPNAAKVMTGEGWLRREVFWEKNRLSFFDIVEDPEKADLATGWVEHLAVGELNGKPGVDVAVVTKGGAWILDALGQTKETVRFRLPPYKASLGPFPLEDKALPANSFKATDIDGDGVCEWLLEDTFSGALALDHQGRTKWQYGARGYSSGEYDRSASGPTDIAAGDLDGDGNKEIVVSWNGMHIFDRNFQKKAVTQEGYTGEILVADTNEDGKNEIVVDAGAAFSLRDVTGSLRWLIKPDLSLGDIAWCQHPNKLQSGFLRVGDGQASLIRFDGKEIFRGDAPTAGGPAGGSLYEPVGAWVRLKSGELPYLAVTGRFVATGRGMLYIYDAGGKLVYHEVLPEEARAIAVLPPVGVEESESLLVGADSTVWRYAVH